MGRLREIIALLRKYRMTALAGALVLVSVWEISVLAGSRFSAPETSDWEQAVSQVQKDFKKGDLIVFAPEWIDPVGRKWFGGMLSVRDAARMDAKRYARVWEISTDDQTSPDVVGEKAKLSKTFGEVRVRRFDRKPTRVTWELRARARVYEVNYQPHTCSLLAVRLPEQPAKLRVPNANLGGTLHVYAGIADFRTRRDNRAVGRLRVLIDGKMVGKATIKNDSGWLGLPPIKTKPGVHTVEFIADVARMNKRIKLDICVAAESRGAR